MKRVQEMFLEVLIVFSSILIEMVSSQLVVDLDVTTQEFCVLISNFPN